MNVQQQVEKIKRQLGISGDAANDLIIRDLFEDWNAAALSICNRDEATPVMQAAGCDAVAAAFLRRGGEGMTGYSAGGQSYSYEDIQKKLYDRLISSNQRVYRL